MTKKQLLERNAKLTNDINIARYALENRDESVKEYKTEYERLQKVNDNVETLNKDLHVKLNAANERIKNLTASIKWLSTSL